MTTPDTLQALVRALAERGDRLALVQITRDGRDARSCGRLAEQARRLAAGLADRGLGAGQRVLLYAPNSPFWVVACLGVLAAGGVPVPVDSQATAEDLRHILANSGARWAFTTERLAGRLADAAAAATQGDGPRQVLMDGDPEAASHMERLLREHPRDRGSESGPDSASAPAPDTEAVLFYTSGTSGPPKGVPLTHANLLSNVSAILGENIVTPADRLLLPLPFHHVYPFALGLVAPLVLGAPVILPYSLTGPQLARALKEGEATAIIGIPRLYGALYSAIERQVTARGHIVGALFRGLLALAVTARRHAGLDLGGRLFAPLRRRLGPRLRLFVSGGAALDPDLAWRLEALGFTVTTGYGLTETSPILAFNPPATGRGEPRFETAGRPLPGVELRIAPPADASPGRTIGDGEVQARGPNVFAGYLDLPERTAAAFTGDGWFRTGDLGAMTPDGRLVLRGRASARIVLPGGENVDPERLEERLTGCSSVREVGVLEHAGTLAALAVPEPAAVRGLDRATIERRIRAELGEALAGEPSYRRVARLRTDATPLPRTRLGKLRRHLLAERFAELERTAGEGRAAAPEPGLADPETLGPEDRQLLEDPAAGRVWEWLGERFPERRIEPDTNLMQDLDVDSLEWVSLTMDLQGRVGLTLEEDAITRIETVRDLLREGAAAGESTAAAVPQDLDARLKDPESLLDQARLVWLDPPRGAHRLLGEALHRLARLIVPPVLRLEVRGLEHLPRSGPCILAPNHLSALDPIAILAALDPERRRIACWGGWTGIMFDRPVMRLASRALRVLPIDPGRNPRSSLALGAAALKRGCLLVWFPEGHRSPDGRLLPFRPGVGRLLVAQPVPTVPLRIHGTWEALPPGSLRLRLKPVTLVVGEPVDVETLKREGRGDSPAERIADALHERVRRLGEEQRPDR